MKKFLRSFLDNLKKNMKKIIFSCLVFALVLTGCNKGGLGSDKVLSMEEAKIKVEEFITLLSPGAAVEIIEVVEDEETGMYKIKVEYGSGERMQEMDSYMSKDGEKFIPQIMVIKEVEKEIKDLREEAQASAKANVLGQAPTASSYSGEDKKDIDEFVSCLASKDFKIYGADWCGWTKKLVVNTFGGFDVVDPIYVECTKEEELCSSEGVTGYPTIKIGGEGYKGDRDFKSFETATGCVAPDVVVPVATTEDASCGN